MKQVIKGDGYETTIITNGHARPILYGWDLPESQRKEFDFLEGERFDEAIFFKYKGDYHYLGDFMRIEYHCGHNHFPGWEGHSSDSYFSGLLVKYTQDYEGVIVGRYWS